MQSLYLKVTDKTLRIIFPEYVTRQTFEKILQQAYLKSKLKSSFPQIYFSFQNITWIDVFEISLLSLWISDLINLKKEVNFNLPLSPIAFSFFKKYKFLEFLSKSTNRNYIDSPLTKDYQNDTIFFPLRFLNKDEFKVFIEDLNYKERIKEVFREISNCEIIKNGSIRDVIFQELGENMYIHAGGKDASIIAIQINKISQDSIFKRISSVSSFEKEFFTNIKDDSYIEVVISDNGPGIYKKLKEAYMSDSDLESKKDNPSHADVINYATRPYTSSRDVEERINFILEALNKDIIENPPVTGLNKLKNVIRVHRGLMLIRSGKGIICYDFLTSPNQVNPQTNDDFEHRVFKDIANFNGTQYKILIPINPQEKTKLSFFKFKFGESNKLLNFNYIRLDDFFSSQSKYETTIAAKQYFQFEKKIENYHLNAQKSSMLIFDFCSAKNVNQKILHLIMIKLMISQSDRQLCTFINLPFESADLLEINPNYSTTNFKPIVGFDTNLNRIIIGLEKSFKDIFNNLISNLQFSDFDFQNFYQKFYYLFDKEDQKFSHNRNQIFSFFYKNLKEQIQDFILDKRSEVFHKEIKVLIPTNKYCEGYFEINKLFQNVELKFKIQQWITYLLLKLKPTKVIGLSEHCSNLVSDSLINITYRIDLLTIKTPIQPIDFIKIKFDLNKEDKIVIFTDVISTANTINNLLNSLEAFNILYVVCVVNATLNKNIFVAEKKISIEDIVQVPIEYHESLPQDWLYSEIHLVDKQTNLLIKKNEIRSNGSMLKDYSIEKQIQQNGNETYNNIFLNKIIMTNSLIEYGHFISNEKHFNFLFNIDKLVDLYGNYLSEQIINHFSDETKKIRLKEDFNTKIIYLNYNPGVEKLCNKITKSINKSELIRIDNNSINNPNPNDFKRNDIALIIDDALISGDSLIRLIDNCEIRGAKYIFIYVLIKRGSLFNARKIENIKKYGRSIISMRYLFDLELPYYGQEVCPLCKIEKNIHKIQSVLQIKNLPFSNYLSRKSNEFKKIYINQYFICSPDPIPNKKITTRWKLEFAKYDLLTQKEILSCLNYYDCNYEIVRDLFSIISVEKEIFFSENIFPPLFIKDLKDTIIRIGNEILFSSKEIYTTDFAHILNILFYLDFENIINKFSDIFEIINNKQDKYFELFYLLFDYRFKLTPYNFRLISIYKKLIRENRIDNEIKEIANELIRNFEKINREFIEYSDKKTQGIIDLYNESFHEFSRTFKNLIIYIEGNRYEKAIDAWETLIDIIEKSIQNIRLLLETGISTNDNVKINNRTSELESTLNKVNTYFEGHKNLNEFVGLINNISDLIIGEKGIKCLITKYQLGLKLLVDRLQEDYKKKFIEKNIKSYYFIPDYSCLIFGEETFIYNILDNLYENVYKHSQATKFIFKIQASIDKKHIEILLMDNGSNIKTIEKGTGLNNVEQIVKKYNGKFSISKSLDNEFETIVKIELINLGKINNFNNE